MKLHKFILIFVSLLNVFLLMNCNKDNNITEPKINITEDEHLKITSKKIGPSGGTIDFGDGTFLSIPENALANEIEISISKIKNALSFDQYGIETFRLEPSGINLNKSVTLQTKYEEYQDFGEDLISVITYNQSQEVWERLKIIEQDQSKNTIKVEIEHFSWFITIFDRPLDLVMEIPGEYLKKGDLIYVMTWEKYLWGADKTFDWFPGHAGLFLGTKDASSFANDSSTTIESSPWEDKPDGVQFSDLNLFKTVFYHLYMGARRYDGAISNDDRTKIATYAIDKLNHGYSKIGEGNITEGNYSCVGLTEASYDYADKDIISAISEFPFILPIEQYIQTVPVNEITVKSNMEVNVPVKGVVRDKTKNEYTDNPSKFTLNASNIPSGATFSNNTLSWIPDQSNVGNTYTVKFSVSAVVCDKSYYRYQDLKITVEQGPISNTQPTALFTVNPTTGTTSTIFNFDASGCTDSEDPTTALQVRWDWENDGTWDTEYSTSKTETHQYSTTGTKTVKLEVEDTGALTNSTTKQITVTDGSNEPQFQKAEFSLPYPLSNLAKLTAYCNYKDVVYIFGGYRESYGWSNSILRMSPANNNIQALSTPLPFSNDGRFIVCNNPHNGLIYLFRLQDVYTFNPNTESFQKILSDSSPESIGDYSIAKFVSSNNSIYIFGNRGSGRGNFILKFDPDTNQFQKLNTNYSPTNNILTGVAYSNRSDAIYLFGGAFSTSYYNSIQKFNPQTHSISTIGAQIPISSGGNVSSYVMDKNKIYIFGGEVYSNDLTQILEFDCSSEQILKLMDMPQSMCHAGAEYIPSLNRIYIFGGRTARSGGFIPATNNVYYLQL